QDLRPVPTLRSLDLDCSTTAPLPPPPPPPPVVLPPPPPPEPPEPTQLLSSPARPSEAPPRRTPRRVIEVLDMSFLPCAVVGAGGVFPAGSDELPVGEERSALALQCDIRPHRVVRCRVGADDGPPDLVPDRLAEGEPAHLGADGTLLEARAQRCVAHVALAEHDRDAPRGRRVGGHRDPGREPVEGHVPEGAPAVVETAVPDVGVAPVVDVHLRLGDDRCQQLPRLPGWQPPVGV